MQRNVADTALRSAREMLKAGAQPSGHPSSTGQAAIWATAIGVVQQFRPDGWEAQAAQLLSHPAALVRYTMLTSLPHPPPEQAVRLLPGLLNDPAASVRWKACETIRRNRCEVALKAVLDLLRRDSEQIVIGECFSAALALGGDRQAVDICVDRLDDPRVSGAMLEQLQSWGSIGQDDGF